MGLSLACGCFGFTEWLSRQIFVCPDWALDCTVSDFVHKIVTHLGQVQGIVTAVYAVAIAMMSHTAYQIAETTIWPALTATTLSMRDIDRYLSLTRGSLAASPQALWHARGSSSVAIVLSTVTVIAVLQLTSSIIVGHAYSVTNVTTIYHSNHSTGGGIGLAFDGYQMNPPGTLPGAAADALSIYTSWANGISAEPMPDQRSFIIDRANLSVVGDFSAYAIQSHMNITCSSSPIRIVEEYSDIFTVNATMSDIPLEIRQQPMLALWVDQWTGLSNTRAITTLIFAAVNGTIEGGFKNGPSDTMSDLGYVQGISSLACDVDVELTDSIICTWKDETKCPEPSTTLSELATLGQPCEGCISVWLAAAIEVYGVSVYGTLPMFQPTLPNSGVLVPEQLGNFSHNLPTAWTSTSSNASQAWSQDVLRNFIDVGSGALATTIMRHFPNTTGTLESRLKMSRLETGRSWLLLFPPGFVLVTVVLVTVVSEIMYSASNLAHVRFGTIGEILFNSQTDDIAAVVDKARKSPEGGGGDGGRLETLRVRYGVTSDGFPGLAHKNNVSQFSGG